MFLLGMFSYQLVFLVLPGRLSQGKNVNDIKLAFSRNIDNYKYNTGQVGFYPIHQNNDNRIIATDDTTTMKKKMSNFNNIWKNPSANCMTSPYWCRDQNFRKYFETRKRHGIEPSVNVNTFYNKDKERDYYDGLAQAKKEYDYASYIK